VERRRSAVGSGTESHVGQEVADIFVLAVSDVYLFFVVFEFFVVIEVVVVAQVKIVVAHLARLARLEVIVVVLGGVV
jgi:hypothetical protein